MWLMTTRGFYSVVEHRDDAERLIVRARCRGDIEALAGLVSGVPVELASADYAWRVEVTRSEWQAAMQCWWGRSRTRTSRARSSIGTTTRRTCGCGA